MNAVIAAGMKNVHRQCCGGTLTTQNNMNPPRIAGASRPMLKRPRLIMNPKMPAKRPRSMRWNHAVLILIMPGAPNDWR